MESVVYPFGIPTIISSPGLSIDALRSDITPNEEGARYPLIASST
jgi:hypothetical protein